MPRLRRLWTDADGYRCPVCGGLGVVPADDNDETLGQRRDYTDREKAALGKQGKAVWLDGHWAFPVASKSDFDAAVTALGRTPGKNRTTVRRYLIALAKKNGWPSPASWNSDGSTKSSGRSALLPPSRLAEFSAEIEALALPPTPSRLTRQHRGHTERGRRERDWLTHRFGAWGVPD